MSSIFDMYINEAYSGQILQEAYYINSGEKIEKKGYCISDMDPRKVKNWKGEDLMFDYTVNPTIQDAIKYELKYARSLEGDGVMYLCKACYINDDYRATRLGDLVEEFKSLKDLAIKYKVDYTEAEKRIANKTNAAQDKASKFPIEDYAELYRQVCDIMLKSLERLKKDSQTKNIIRAAITKKLPSIIAKNVSRYKSYYNRPNDAEFITKLEQEAKEYIDYYSTKSFPLPEIQLDYNVANDFKNRYKPFSSEDLYLISNVSNTKQSKYFEGEVNIIVIEEYYNQMLRETRDSLRKLRVGNFRITSVKMNNPDEIYVGNNYPG